jgi:ADP-heptose:LPS heptosyltransferase
MKRILVIQLCRLGDILQTTPMLRGLRRAHPQASITLMVLDGFSHAPLPRHLYDHLAVFPFDAVGASVQSETGQWREALEHARGFVRELGAAPFDLVLNLTNSGLANLLCALVPSREVRGGLIAPDRSRVVRHPWMTYFWASLLAREFGCVNLVDLFCRVAEVPIDGDGLEIAVPEAAEARVQSWLQTAAAIGEPLVALQLGASDERKRWTPEQFAAMANRLPERAGTIVLIGSAAERPLGERAAAGLTRRHLNAMGETSVVELAALVRRCRLLVTNDTGTMHVATAVGTPVLDLSTGPVFVHETGPYAVGSLAVEPTMSCFPCAAGAMCHHLTCREDFTPDDIAALVMFAIEGGDLPRPSRAKVLQATRAGSGRLEFRPLWDPSGGGQERLRHAFGLMWDRSLGHVMADPRAAGVDATLDADEAPHVAALERFAARADRASALSVRIASAPASEAGRLATELNDALQQELLAATLEPLLRPLVGYLRTALDALTDRSVIGLSRSYQREWRATASRARLLAGTLAVPMVSR